VFSEDHQIIRDDAYENVIKDEGFLRAILKTRRQSYVP
jgi:hypothetical protein